MMAYLLALLLFGCVIEAIFIVQERKQHLLAALLLKAGASLLFVLAGFVAFSLAFLPSFGRMIVLGLMLGAIGDVCLNLRFLLTGRARLIFLFGIGAFLLGHIAYLVALIGLDPMALLYALPIAAALSFVLIRFVLARIEVSGAIKVFGIVYLCVVFLMACVCVALFVLAPLSPGRAVFAAGALLFAASDVFLVFNQFGKKAYPSFRALNLSLYYLGQVCICLTIALMR
ncbi:MAG TPA: lysoplasmalogenase family protein [Clostridia bacterium]|nr:lysoplasmalogenase family protein [Clostridia bacterium]